MQGVLIIPHGYRSRIAKELNVHPAVLSHVVNFPAEKKAAIEELLHLAATDKIEFERKVQHYRERFAKKEAAV
jgi:hypothetical protein